MEEACLYAVNTLKATLVEYKDKGSSITINGAEIVTGASKPTYVTSSIYNQATSINKDKGITPPATTPWSSPSGISPTWNWTATPTSSSVPLTLGPGRIRDIGTYVDYSLMVAEYTTGVSGRDLYDVLTASTIRDAELMVYVDGSEAEGDEVIAKSQMVRSNSSDVGVTDNAS